MSHNDLANYYKTNFALKKMHDYSIPEIEDLLIFERDIYCDLISDHIKKIEQAKANAK